jgi:HIP---CoA ligase
MVRRAAGRWEDAEAVVDGEVRLSFRDVERLMVRSIRAALASGVERGDRVALWAPNTWEWIVAALGVLGAGGWVVPVNTRFKGDEAAYVLAKARARMLLTVTGFLDNDYVGMLRDAAPRSQALDDVVTIRGEPPADGVGWDEYLARGDAVGEADAHAAIDRLGPDDVADVMFTSGTTGRPKGVPITHGQSLRYFDAFGNRFGLQAGDRCLIVNPFFHAFGYKAGWMLCLLKGATALPVAVFEARSVTELIERERISALPGPPTLLSAVLDLPDRDAHDLSSLRIGFVGASSVPAELLHRMRTELPFRRVTTGYGLTEASAMCSITRPDDPPDYVSEWNGGAPLADIRVKVVDDEGDGVPAGRPGELLIKGGNVMSGYLEDPEATAAAFDAGGWLHTGDVGVMNERGDIKITDRKKDIYICGGFNVSPAEVESLLASMDGVAQVAVVGMPDARLGEVGTAFVRLRPGSTTTPADVVAWARRHMANYKVPRRVEIVDSLPLNATGKVMKTLLRARRLPPAST